MIKEIEEIHHMIDFVRNLSYCKLFSFSLSQAGVRNKHLQSELTFTCSKSTIETLKKVVKYVQS